MTTHTSAPVGHGQCDRILARLQQSAGQWVSLMDLHRASGSMNVHSRVADLRNRPGIIIEQKNIQHGRTKHSHYRLIPTEEQPMLF